MEHPLGASVFLEKRWACGLRQHSVSSSPGWNEEGEEGTWHLCVLSPSWAGGFSAAVVTHACQTPHSSAFDRWLLFTTFPGDYGLSALDWDSLHDLTCSEASSCLDRKATWFPNTPFCKWSMWDWPGSEHVRQSNKFPLIILYSIDSLSLENSD